MSLIEFAQVVPECFVHERIYERIRNVIDEVHVEDGHPVRYELQRHEERGQVRDDKYDSHDKQDGGRLEVGDAVLLASRQRPSIDLLGCAVVGRVVHVDRHVVVLRDHRDHRLVALNRRRRRSRRRRAVVVAALRRRQRPHERRRRALLSLAAHAAREHRAINEDVEDEHDDETGEVQSRVELLEYPLEVAADDDLRETTLAVVRVRGCHYSVVVWRRRRSVVCVECDGFVESSRQGRVDMDDAVHQRDQQSEHRGEDGHCGNDDLGASGNTHGVWTLYGYACHRHTQDSDNKIIYA